MFAQLKRRWAREHAESSPSASYRFQSVVIRNFLVIEAIYQGPDAFLIHIRLEPAFLAYLLGQSRDLAEISLENPEGFDPETVEALKRNRQELAAWGLTIIGGVLPVRIVERSGERAVECALEVPACRRFRKELGLALLARPKE